MYTLSENCPRKDVCVQNGKGLIHIKDLTDKEGLYGHGRMFSHVTVVTTTMSTRPSSTTSSRERPCSTTTARK